MHQSIVISCKKWNENTEVPSIDRSGLHVFANDCAERETVNQILTY